MRRVRIVRDALILLVLTAACGRGPAEPELAPARLEVEAADLALGRRDWGERLTRTLVLRNAGERPLAVIRVTSRCGCARVEFEGGEIPAGGRLEIPVHLDLRVAAGTLRKPIEIATGLDEPRHVWIEAEIRPPFAIEPPGADRLEVDAGSAVRGTFRLRSLIGTAPRVARVLAGGSLTLSEPRPAGSDGLEFDLEYRSAGDTGWRNETVVLECERDDPHLRLEVPLRIWVRGPLAASPRELRADEETPLLLSAPEGRRLEIGSLTIEPATLPSPTRLRLDAGRFEIRVPRTGLRTAGRLVVGYRIDDRAATLEIPLLPRPD
ncbi:MAG: DUF1573 domain-containing protein [Planctomycetota bacterium]